MFVIPNAVDTTQFVPEKNLTSPDDRINIVVICRMTYRKGVDLLIDIIPEVLRRHPNAHFILGGDGPKLDLLKELRNQLNTNRIEILGRVAHNDVKSVLCRGHIFLNTSLTEAFCIALVEAASCGLLSVSTNVGGIPELLPSDMIYLADPDPE